MTVSDAQPVEETRLARALRLVEQATTEPEIVHVPRTGYLLVDGAGFRESAAQLATERDLETLAQRLLAVREARGHPPVPALPRETWLFDPSPAPRARARWTCGVPMPDDVDADVWAEVESTRRALPVGRRARLVDVEEGLCVQSRLPSVGGDLRCTARLLRSWAAARYLVTHPHVHLVRATADGTPRTVLRIAAD